MSFLALIVGRYLLGLRRRTHVAAVSLVSFSAMALGAAALVITLALLEGFQSTIRAQLAQGGPHAMLRPTEGRRLPRGDWLDRLRQARPDLTARLVRSGAVWAVSEDSAVPATLVMVESSTGVALTRVLAARVGVGAGDRLTLASPRQVLTPLGPMPLRRRVDVDAVLPLDGESRAEVRVPPSIGDALLGGAGTETVELRGGDPGQAFAVASSVQALVPDGVDVVSFRELNRPLLAALALERAMIGFGVALVMVVAALNLLCNLALLAAEKRADVALLTALGLPERAVGRLFVLLGVGVGVLGGTLGAGLGAAIAVALDRTGLLPLPHGVFVVSHVPFRVTPEAVAIVLTVSLIAALLASLPPARAAARRGALEGLRYE